MCFFGCPDGYRKSDLVLFMGSFTQVVINSLLSSYANHFFVVLSEKLGNTKSEKMTLNFVKLNFVVVGSMLWSLLQFILKITIIYTVLIYYLLLSFIGLNIGNIFSIFTLNLEDLLTVNVEFLQESLECVFLAIHMTHHHNWLTWTKIEFEFAMWQNKYLGDSTRLEKMLNDVEACKEILAIDRKNFTDMMSSEILKNIDQSSIVTIWPFNATPF